MSTPKQKIVLNVFVQPVYASWLNQFEVSWISMPLLDAKFYNTVLLWISSICMIIIDTVK